MADGINLNNGPISINFDSLINYYSFNLSAGSGLQASNAVNKTQYTGFILMFSVTAAWQYGSSSTNGSLFVPSSASTIYLGYGNSYNQCTTVLFSTSNITVKNAGDMSSTITFFCIP